MDFSLVLDEEGIAHELRSTGENRWALMVDEADLVRAQAALTAFERENPLPIPRVQAPRPPTPAVACGLALFLSILAFHVWTGPESAASPWFSRGGADPAGHLCGFACGVLLGAGVSPLPPLRGRVAQAALAFIAAAAPVAAWLAAFR